MQRWWGNAAAAEAEVRLALDSPSAICRMIMLGPEPIGYAQALDLAMPARAPAASLPPGAWDADLFIAVPEHRGQGYGALALQLLAAEVFSTTLAPALSIVVSVRSEAAVRAFERVGFRWVAVEADPLSGPSWVMVQERP